MKFDQIPSGEKPVVGSEGDKKEKHTIADLEQMETVTGAEFISVLDDYVSSGASVGRIVTSIMDRISFTPEEVEKVRDLAKEGAAVQASHGFIEDATQFLKIIQRLGSVKKDISQ